MSKPNQRTIYVKRKSDKTMKDYFKISNKNLQIAMYNLKTNSFKLYVYLCDNSDGYIFDLYSCDFERVAGVSYDTYLSSFKDLVEKGYLRPHKTEKNTFIFDEESPKKLEGPPKHDKIKSLCEEDFEEIEEEFSQE